MKNPNQSQDEILTQLLNEINPVDLRDYLNLPAKEDFKQKHLLVGIVKNLSEIAKSKHWNLCKNNDYTYVYNGEYWKQIEKDSLKDFIG